MIFIPPFLHLSLCPSSSKIALSSKIEFPFLDPLPSPSCRSTFTLSPFPYDLVHSSVPSSLALSFHSIFPSISLLLLFPFNCSSSTIYFLLSVMISFIPPFLHPSLCHSIPSSLS
uniref:Uncharacterized protein n=1 Tax=Cacopsylla melanoneura TaxID=428564 RepID=A0A8D8TE88_9HEMI